MQIASVINLFFLVNGTKFTVWSYLFDSIFFLYIETRTMEQNRIIKLMKNRKMLYNHVSFFICYKNFVSLVFLFYKNFLFKQQVLSLQERNQRISFIHTQRCSQYNVWKIYNCRVSCTLSIMASKVTQCKFSNESACTSYKSFITIKINLTRWT